MQTYLVNKLLSIAILIASVFLGLWLFGYGDQAWLMAWFFLLVFGYGHFLLGFYYQVKAFLRKQQAVLYLSSLAVFTGLGVLLAKYLYFEVGPIVSLLTATIYFLIHGAFNEQTLAFRQTGHKPPLLIFFALVIFLFVVWFYSLVHHTVFIDTATYVFPLTTSQVQQFFISNGITAQIQMTVLVGGFVTSLLLLIYSYFRQGRNSFTVAIAILISLLFAGVLLFGKPDFMYILQFIIGYHFMTWLLFYLVEMKRRGEKAYRTFIIQNVLVTVSVLVAVIFFYLPQTPNIAYFILDYNVFMTATFIHITTSFLNEEWMQSLQARMFKRLGGWG